MKKIGLHGSYFVRNFGDTLILQIVKQWIKSYSSEIDITLPFVATEMEALEILGNDERKDTKIEELDGLIFGPGGYFGERPGNFINKLRWSIRNYKRHIIWNDKLYKHDIPYIIIGVGVGPISFKFLRRRVVKLFNKSKFISVRDEKSKQYLIDWGMESGKINVLPDVALTLQQIKTVNKKEKPKVAIHYTNSNLLASGKLNDFVEFIKYINDKNEICFLEDSKGQFTGTANRGFINALKENGIEIPVIEYRGPSELITSLQDIDKVITSKLHVGIVSYALGKKILSIPLHTKTIRFYNQIKLDEFCVPLNEINTEVLCDKFEKLDFIENSENILYSEAVKNKNILYEFLNTI